jgi:hypothetical protein
MRERGREQLGEYLPGPAVWSVPDAAVVFKIVE